MVNFKKVFFDMKINYFLNKKSISKTIKNIDNLSSQQLKTLNFKKRKAIVEYAYANIPFYKSFYDTHNFHPEDLITDKDWLKIPILTKNSIKNQAHKLRNPSLNDKYFRKSVTGGSTGVPLTVYFDKRVPLEVFGWRVLNWWGLEPWENQAYVYRNVRSSIKQHINDLLWWPTKRALLDCSSMSNSDIEIFITKLNKIKPKIIQGYVGGIFDLAKYIAKNNIKLSFKPKCIWVTAAPIPNSTRILIESVFEAPVYDQYGCSEIFWLAAECTMQCGLHVLSDIRYIEFLDINGDEVLQDEYGDVIITDLENRAFPLIRYKNGDRGRYLKRDVCVCGLPYPLIDKIKGRVTDSLKMPSGLIIDGSYLTTIFDEHPDLIEGFQVVQGKDYSITINCVLRNGILSEDSKFILIRKQLELKARQEVVVRLLFVDSLVQDRGKMKFIISHLNS